MDDERKPVGRPSKYRPEYCERVIELGKEGKSKTQIAVNIGVSKSSLDRWCEEHEEFRTALTHAKECEQAWFEEFGMKAMSSPSANFNAAIWKKSVEARFRDDYTDRRQLSGPDNGPINVNQIALVPGKPNDDAGD